METIVSSARAIRTNVTRTIKRQEVRSIPAGYDIHPIYGLIEYDQHPIYGWSPKVNTGRIAGGIGNCRNQNN